MSAQRVAINSDHPGLKADPPHKKHGDRWVPLVLSMSDIGTGTEKKFEEVIYGLRRLGIHKVEIKMKKNGLNSLLDRINTWLRENDPELQYVSLE